MELSLSIAQKQILSQRMQLSVSILQMNVLALTDYVQELSMENPVLDLEEPMETPLWESKEGLAWLTEKGRESYVKNRPHETSFQLGESRAETLCEHLMQQIGLLPIKGDLQRGLRYLAESVDTAGYLEEGVLQAMTKCLGIDDELSQEALTLFQSLEPYGVGARCLKECLLLQIKRKEKIHPLCEPIVSEYIELLAKNQLHMIAKKLGEKLVAVVAACDEIRSLNPKPGSGFAVEGEGGYIFPELFLVQEGEGIQVVLREGALPKLSINGYYKDILTADTSEAAKSYVSQKLRQAQWVMQCIEKRKETIQTIGEIIAKKQARFFLETNGELCPMRLLDVAEEAGIHESTVSRTIHGKYLQCQRGVYPLSYFFTTAVKTNTESLSSMGVKNRIHTLIEGEDKGAPFSDGCLTELLQKEGITISRRTVAKYREAMGIPAQSRRKKF